MKSLSCRDMGGMDCDYKATGENAAEVKKKMYQHAKEKHSDKLKTMTEEEMRVMDKRMDELLA